VSRAVPVLRAPSGEPGGRVRPRSARASRGHDEALLAPSAAEGQVDVGGVGWSGFRHRPAERRRGKRPGLALLGPITPPASGWAGHPSSTPALRRLRSPGSRRQPSNGYTRRLSALRTASTSPRNRAHRYMADRSVIVPHDVPATREKTTANSRGCRNTRDKAATRAT
jgi:hypothetical protein